MSSARVRGKSQVTIPGEVLLELGVKPGDRIEFLLEDDGRMVVRGIKEVPVDQSWFWSPEWQEGERQVDEEATAGRVRIFEDDETFFGYLDS